MNYKVKRLDNDKTIAQGTNLIFLTVLEEDFIITKSDGKIGIFDKKIFYVTIADC